MAQPRPPAGRLAHAEKESRRRDSNPGPPLYESGALPAELRRQVPRASVADRPRTRSRRRAAKPVQQHLLRKLQHQAGRRTCGGGLLAAKSPDSCRPDPFITSDGQPRVRVGRAKAFAGRTGGHRLPSHSARIPNWGSRFHQASIRQRSAPSTRATNSGTVARSRSSTSFTFMGGRESAAACSLRTRWVCSGARS